MLTKDMLLNNMIGAYFIDNDRKNIEILCTSEDKKSVNATIIPYDENNSMFKTLMLVTTIDELHENTYKKKKEEKKIFEQKVIEIAKKDGLVFDEYKLDTKFYPTLVKAIFEDEDNEDHLFALKLALFEVDKIKNSTDNEKKSELRKSKPKSEVLLKAINIINA